jgi:hypothetical protein
MPSFWAAVDGFMDCGERSVLIPRA